MCQDPSSAWGGTKRHQQDKPYPDVWRLNWRFVVKDGMGQEFELVRGIAAAAGRTGQRGGSERGHTRCPRALVRLLAPIVLLKLVLPLPNPGWALPGGTAGSVHKGQIFSEKKKKKLAPSLLPLSSLATQVTYNYVVWTTKRGALHGTNAVRQTGRCLFFFTTWMTGCHKVIGVLVAALSPCRFLQGAVAEQVSISAWLLSGPTEKGCFCHPGAVFLKDCTSCNAFPCIFPAAAFFFLGTTPAGRGAQLHQPFLLA